MSRAGTADTVIVKATSNVYTVLVFASFLAVVGGIMALYFKAITLFGEGGLFNK